MKHGQGEMEQTDLGAKRESNKGRGRFDLLPYEAMEALAIWYEQSILKYEEHDWEKGMSVKDCITRAYRHMAKAAGGWTDEDHLAAVMWNAAAAITMMKRRPDCDDNKWLKKRISYVDEVKRKEYEKKYYEVPGESEVPITPKSDGGLKSKHDDFISAILAAQSAINNSATPSPWTKYKRSPYY